MKKLLLSLTAIALLGTYMCSAQTGNDYLEMTREVIKVEKKAAIAEVMQLTEAESAPFWTLYNEYQGKLYLIQNKRIAIIKDFGERIICCNL